MMSKRREKEKAGALNTMVEIFNKSATAIQWGKESFFCSFSTNVPGTVGYPHAKKINLHRYLIIYKIIYHIQKLK